jgi:hypothetical protein
MDDYVSGKTQKDQSIAMNMKARDIVAHDQIYSLKKILPINI